MLCPVTAHPSSAGLDTRTPLILLANTRFQKVFAFILLRIKLPPFELSKAKNVSKIFDMKCQRNALAIERAHLKLCRGLGVGERSYMVQCDRTLAEECKHLITSKDNSSQFYVKKIAQSCELVSKVVVLNMQSGVADATCGVCELRRSSLGSHV